MFRIGSVTKALTAAVLRLVGEGRFALPDPLAHVWPGWPPAWSAVTPHHLLVHPAGLAGYVPEPDFPAGWLPSISAAAPTAFRPARISRSDVTTVQAHADEKVSSSRHFTNRPIGALSDRYPFERPTEPSPKPCYLFVR